MPVVSSTSASVTALPRLGAWPRGRLLVAAVAGVATALVVVSLATLVLLQPLFTHWALDRAGSATLLGLGAEETRAVSDRTIGELIAGPGTFAFGVEAGGPPFYDAAEASHLRDARLLLWLLLGGGLAGAAFLALLIARAGTEAWPWRGISLGGAGLAVAFILVGAAFLLAFEFAFEQFHRLFFPQGNWAFDPATQRIVRLYPTPFWQLAVGALGLLGICGGLACWWVGRSVARRRARSAASGG